MRTVILFVASAGFAGYSPLASGTVGSIVAVPIFWAFAHLQTASLLLYLAAFALAVLGACWIAGKAEEILQEHDSHAIVIDEIAGFLAATLFLAPTWGHTIVAFLFFRAFDIVKPFPAGTIDRQVSGGPGVVLDDVISGLYANIATRLVFMFV